MRLQILGAAVATLVLAGCGGGANVVATDGTTASANQGGVGIEMDCGHFVLPKLLREMKSVGYLIALVRVDSAGEPTSVPGERSDLVYTPLSATYETIYAGTRLPVLYVPGGSTSSTSTLATGPSGVVPGESAVVMVPPQEMRNGAPAGWIETALPVQDGFAFAGDTCWERGDTPQSQDATWQVTRMDSGHAAGPATEAGFAFPVTAIQGVLSGG